jgi:hypothetical protein
MKKCSAVINYVYLFFQLTESESVSGNVQVLCTEAGIKYYRLSPTTEEVVGLGETERDKLIQLVLEWRQCEDTKLLMDQLEKDLRH